MRSTILRSGMLLVLASAVMAETELFFAAGVDSTGWAQAQSNADGHVLIESPEYPRGLWLHLVDEQGMRWPAFRSSTKADPTAWWRCAASIRPEMCRRRWCGPGPMTSPCA